VVDQLADRDGCRKAGSGQVGGREEYAGDAGERQGKRNGHQRRMAAIRNAVRERGDEGREDGNDLAADEPRPP
jgi:hypothetical protein